MQNENHRRDGNFPKETARLFLPALLFLCIAIAGCSHSKPSDTSGGRIVFVTGKAQIVSFDPDMRYAVLTTTHGTRTAWWNTNTQITRNGQSVSISDWQGKPGDQLEIAGFLANGEVFLKKVMLK